jgi:hypothetical protein
MLITEQDAVMKKWCPMIRLRWESRPFAYNRSNPGRSARFRNMPYRIFFPRLHHEMRGKFLPMPRVGLHDVAMGDQRSTPIRAAEGIASIGAAQGILWLGRHALHVHCAVMEPRVARRRPRCRYFDTVRAAVGQCHIIGRLPWPNRRNYHAIQLGK